MLGLRFGLWSASEGGISALIWCLRSDVVGFKSGLGLELKSAGVEVLMIWSLISVVDGL